MPLRRKTSKASGNRRLSTSVMERRKFVLEVKARKTTADRTRRRAIFRWTWIFLFWILFAGGFAISIQTVLEKFFFENPDYNLSDLELESGGVLTPEEVGLLTGIKHGTNLFRIDLGVAEAALENIPEVTTARVHRKLPDTISVNLEIRDPVAWVADASDAPDVIPYLLVDQYGEIYRPRRVLDTYFALPVLTGVRIQELEDGDILHREDLREALTLLQTRKFHPDSTLDIRSINIGKGYCLEVTDASNATVLFNPGNYPQQLDRLQKLLDHCKETGRELEMVNLIPNRNTPVRFVMASPPPPRAEAVYPEN